MGVNQARVGTRGLSFALNRKIPPCCRGVAGRVSTLPGAG